SHREQHRPGLRGFVVLTHYPVRGVEQVLTGRADVLSLHALHDPLRAVASATTESLVLSTTDNAGDLTRTTLSWDDHPTTASLAQAVSSLDAWQATATRDALTTTLWPDTLDATQGTVHLAAAGRPVRPTRLDHGSGTVRVAGAGRAPVQITYE